LISRDHCLSAVLALQETKFRAQAGFSQQKTAECFLQEANMIEA
jgi:hypothetical protein